MIPLQNNPRTDYIRELAKEIIKGLEVDLEYLTIDEDVMLDLILNHSLEMIDGFKELKEEQMIATLVSVLYENSVLHMKRLEQIKQLTK